MTHVQTRGQTLEKCLLVDVKGLQLLFSEPNFVLSATSHMKHLEDYLPYLTLKSLTMTRIFEYNCL